MSQQTDDDAGELRQAAISHKFASLVEQIPALKDHKNKHAERIAVLLDSINCRHLILETFDLGINDFWLPFPKGCEPPKLGPTAFHNFREKQLQLLSDTFTVDEAESPIHANLSDKAIGSMNVPDSLTFGEFLGSGGFGEVSQVTYTNKGYALKRIRRKTDSKDAHEQMLYITIELGVMRRIRHNHCIKLVASYSEPKHIGILMDPAADYNLEDYLGDFPAGDRTEQSKLAGFFGCLATALEYLHYGAKIRHKDIKPRNILVHGVNILFTDFGMALDWSETGVTTTRQEQLRSPEYCAPEVAYDRHRNSKSDIWSLGCVFLEMTAVLMGRRLEYVKETLVENGSEKYWDCTEGIRNIIEDLRQDAKASGWGDQPLDWVESMLRTEKEHRPDSRDLRQKILEAKSKGGKGFCGYCCTTATLDADSDDGSPSRSTKLAALGRDQGSGGAGVEKPAVQSMPQCAQVHDPSTLEWIEVELVRNPQASGNWIAADIAGRLGLDVVQDTQTVSFSVEGIRLESREYVQVTWKESQDTKTRWSSFFVARAERLPFQLLVKA